MRTLVHNYSSEISTEPLAFAQALHRCGQKVHVWNNERSAFDMFDDFNPDVFITNFMMITVDIIKRLRNADTKVAINVTGAKQDHLDYIKSVGVKAFFFQSHPNLEDVYISRPFADIYLGERNAEGIPDYKADTLFVVNSKDDLALVRDTFPSKNSFHVVTTSRDLIEFKEVDAYVPIAPLSKLYPKYNEVIVTKPNQAFYDAAYYGPGCQLFEGEENSFFLRKEVVESVHTPYNRVVALFEQFGENIQNGGNYA